MGRFRLKLRNQRCGSLDRRFLPVVGFPFCFYSRLIGIQLLFRGFLSRSVDQSEVMERALSTARFGGS